ncbi:MAG: STAS domain-containing protein, partial [Rhodospirillales bacterium]|nr:STAS domain-containing protein [Rhodospirillales bacterium]
MAADRPAADRPAAGPPASLALRDGVLTIGGALDIEGAADLWPDLLRAAAQARGRPLVFDLAAVTRWDSAGATLLAEAERLHGGNAEWRGA